MAAEEVTNGVDLSRPAPCPQCGYDLRGQSTEVCPECNFNGEDWERRRFRIPWQEGRVTGRRGWLRGFRDYVVTTWLILGQPKQFASAVFGRISWSRAISYRRWTIVGATLSLWLSVVMLELFVYGKVHVRMLSREVLIIAPTVATPLALWLFTVIPPEFFRARSGRHIQVRMNPAGELGEERAAGLAQYASATLNVLWLTPPLVLALPSWISWKDALALEPWLFGGLLAVAAGMYGLRLLALARWSLHRGAARAMWGYVVGLALTLIMWGASGPLTMLAIIAYLSLTA
ncbi:MAG: hypothetical protein KDA32_10365 [Phycisphaerales bacterium]|nr:hypothetical protein [Phycisphaerales bacterium]